MSVELKHSFTMDERDIESSQDVQALLDDRLQAWKMDLRREGIEGEVFISMERSLVDYGKVTIHAEIRPRPQQPSAKVISILDAPSLRK